ncbi:hypothetical protein PG984_011623 [Apiospora sp. TS-2023a]
MSETIQKSGPPKVIHAALLKMGTKSLAEAYKILGYHTHHGLDDLWGNPWEKIEKASEATWPAFAGPNAGSAAHPATSSTPFTREQWNDIWGSYDAITDLASPFTEELVQAYPEAKVVVVQRDFEPWWRSVRSGILDPTFGRSSDLVMLVATIPPVMPTRKQMLGFFGARSGDEIDESKARAAYERHFRRVRELVPAERRLEYTMGSGWEPLCKFLGKDIPVVPFPLLNEGKEFAKHNKNMYRAGFLLAWAAIKPWALSTLAVGGVAVVIKYWALANSS